MDIIDFVLYFALGEGGKRDFKAVFIVKSLQFEVLCGMCLVSLAASTERACPRFLAMVKVNTILQRSQSHRALSHATVFHLSKLNSGGGESHVSMTNLTAAKCYGNI